MWILMAVCTGCIWLEGRFVFVSRNRKLKTLYWIVFAVGIGLCTIGILGAKDAILESIQQFGSMVAEWGGSLWDR